MVVVGLLSLSQAKLYLQSLAPNYQRGWEYIFKHQAPVISLPDRCLLQRQRYPLYYQYHQLRLNKVHVELETFNVICVAIDNALNTHCHLDVFSHVLDDDDCPVHRLSKWHNDVLTVQYHGFYGSSTTAIITSISGQLTTYMTKMPTFLATSCSSSSDVNRTALIAGVTALAVVLVALALDAMFIYKRAQKRRRDLPNMSVSIPRSMPSLSLLQNLQITSSLLSSVVNRAVHSLLCQCCGPRRFWLGPCVGNNTNTPTPKRHRISPR
ncbi:hypothetical protein IW261DRAFT_1573507 [Armillaria novae-zelandiae]|uniref:Uncharacterized protein n=1 Tax=Armillaria novae-zelandiae TaxID=153914 RepID=A0AA39T6X4_9AGAR|nr:hypothetical protein IW261DRAFT_1573507 [Armillaria novae-zelandiae]